MCKGGGERVGENVYRVPGVCPVGSNDFELKKIIKISDPVMGAKLNFKTYLQNRIFNFLSHLSEGPKSYDCTKTLVLYILLSLCG